MSTSPHFVAVAAATQLDFVFIDTEHIALDRHTLAWMCQAYGAAGVAPVVRVPAAASPAVTGALDGGAVGVVAPYMETVEQVLTLVGATKLRPLKGALLQACLDVVREAAAAAQGAEVQGVFAGVPGYTDPLDLLAGIVPPNTLEFMRKKADGKLVFINVESQAAIENLPALLSVPGVDGVFIGPKDLSVQLGVPDDWESSVFLEACDRIVSRTAERGLAVGCHYSFAHSVQRQTRWRALGANLIVHESDLKLYARALATDLAALRGSAEGSESKSAGGALSAASPRASGGGGGMTRVDSSMDIPMSGQVADPVAVAAISAPASGVEERRSSGLGVPLSGQVLDV